MEFQKDEQCSQNQTLLKSLKDRIADNPAVVALGTTDALIRANGDVEFIMPVKYEHTNTHGIVHGGIFVTLLDTVMGYACYFKSDQHGTVTLNINTSFIANCTPGSTVKAVGRTIHAGRRVMVAEGEIYDETGRLLCTGQGTFYAKGDAKNTETITN